MFDPCEHYKEFYNNPIIKSVEHVPRWTVSDKDKMPIDMYSLLYEHRIAGAQFTDEKSLVALPVICKNLPMAANHAFYLDALVDGFVVLDIEPKCPQEIKDELLKLPYVYGETSMSGKGIHLLFYLPDCISEYPIAQKKQALKEGNGYYEILLNHYVTFTRNAIPPSNSDKTTEDFVKVFRELAEVQVDSFKGESFDVSKDMPEVPFQDMILSTLMKQSYRKTPDDFTHDDGSHDLSKYEYAYVGFLRYKLGLILETSKIKAAHTYSDNEKAWLVYEAAKEVIPYRDKHDTERNGLPWLLFLARESIANDMYAKS